MDLEKIIRTTLESNNIRLASPSKIPGSPNFYIESCQLALFIYNCSLHGHSCLPASLRNQNAIMQDIDVIKNLKRAGCNVIILWECDLISKPLEVQSRLLDFLKVRNPIVNGY